MKNKKLLPRVEIKAALDKALAGSRKLKLTFNADAFVDMFYLLGMHEKILTLTDMGYMNLYAVATSKRWEGVPRSFVVSLVPNFDAEAEDWFLGRMNDRALEAIEAA